MGKRINWSKYFDIDISQHNQIKRFFGVNNFLGMGLMPIRGPKGFRKLDYEFASKQLDVEEVMNKLEHYHVNFLGLVIKDTDGACVWNTDIGWNPTQRDILGEFCDVAKDHNIKLIVSFTSMNDAYQGAIHPERVSVHGKSGKKNSVKFEKGQISTHLEGEMRIDLPEGISFKQYQEQIPFLTQNIDKGIGKARGSRGRGYIPTTSFMCPNSEHSDYLLQLTKEVVKNYDIKGFFADYIRYDGDYTDLCACEICIQKFRDKYGIKPKLFKSKEWYEFKAVSIVEYAEKLHITIKNSDDNCISGWFCLPGPKKILSQKRLGQDWEKLSSIFDLSSPMEYPYLMGTRDDGLFWGMLGDFFNWYYIRNMKKRAHEFKNPVLAITNSVECNNQEMLKQMRNFNFGYGIALFKYFGTSEEQWKVIKKYAETELKLGN
jgi:hypothetical protein